MKTLRKGSGRFLGWLLTIVMVCGLLLSNGISVKAAGSIGNNGYPYGKNMSINAITLICEATGAQQYQWQVSDAEDGTYTNIDSATAAEYTFTPENMKWYRCVVDGTPSKAVQAVKPGEDERTWTDPYNSWYLSNGKVAYYVNGYEFDIVGAYQKGNTTYMLQTSYSSSWQMYGGDGASGRYSDYSSSAPHEIHFSFDDVAVNVNVELVNETDNFAFGCDTQLGDNITSGGYSDSAALVAALNGDNTLKHIAMVGAAAVNEETDPNAPAFVIEPQGNPLFWIGGYSGRKVYDYNEDEDEQHYTKSEVKKNDGSTGSVVTSVQGKDSGMTMSWKGVSSVQFSFKVGTAKNTGAVSGNVNYLNDSIDGLDPSTRYVIEVKDESGTTVATYNILSDANGAIPFEGTDVNGTAFDLTGKSLSITKEGSTDTPANLDIAARPTPEDAKQTTDENYVKPEDVAENEVLTTENSITIHPETASKVKQNYKIFNADGTAIAGQDWVAVDANGDVVFSGLSERTEYLIKAIVPATQTTPHSYESEGVKITTMGTIEVTNPTELSFVQDGLEHEFEITTTPADANKVYSLLPEENYTEEIVKLKDPGRYTVYYKASKDNYRTVYGSFDAEIREAAPTDIVAVAKDYNGVYDGKAHSIEIEVVVPQTGAVVSYGTKEGEYTLTGNPSYTDVGTYKVFYRVTAEGRDEKTGSADIIIEKADSTVTTAPAAQTLAYNGQAQELVTAGTATGGEMQYALGTDATTAPANNLYTTSIPTGTDEGIYYVWYKAVGDDNHSDSDAAYVEATIKSVTAGITLDPDKLPMNVGGKETIKATVVPEGSPVTWTTDKESVATVDTEGNVTAVSEGTAIIKGTISVGGKDYSAECEVTVTKDKPVVTPEITFDADKLPLKAGEKKTITAKVVPEETAIKWTTDKESVATVDTEGNVTGVSEGTAIIRGTITVDGKDYTAECEVTVVTPGITFDADKLPMKAGEKKTITAKVVPEETAIKWTTDKESVATVDTEGNVTAVSEGTAIIKGTITYEGKDYSAECEVTVTEDKPVVKPEISFDATSLSIQTEEEKTIKATVKPEGQTVIWTTDNAEVATVDGDGKVKAISEGTATIKGTITVDGVDYIAECKVTVTGSAPQPAPVEGGITLNFSQIVLYPGREKALKATTVPEGCAVKWSSSDSTVATVTQSGVVTGLRIGMATITASIEVDGTEYSASCLVNVVPETYIDTGSGEHTHKYVWNTIEATEDADGELRYQCETCGDIKERVPLTAYNVFNMNTTEKIRKAPKDATVRIETNKWISFHKMVMEALAERPDVTLEISFLDEGHKGNRCTVVIPKGTDTMSLVDKNGFTGFLFLGGKFGMKTN